MLESFDYHFKILVGTTPTPCDDAGCGYVSWDQFGCLSGTSPTNETICEKRDCCQYLNDSICSITEFQHFCRKTCGLCESGSGNKKTSKIF